MPVNDAITYMSACRLYYSKLPPTKRLPSSSPDAHKDAGTAAAAAAADADNSH